MEQLEIEKLLLIVGLLGAAGVLIILQGYLLTFRQRVFMIVKTIKTEPNGVVDVQYKYYVQGPKGRKRKKRV